MARIQDAGGVSANLDVETYEVIPESDEFLVLVSDGIIRIEKC
jgi:serine/threonine protein phosphatase PrpC